jgi:hypothetical protein
MENTPEPGRITRWHWDKLANAKTRAEVEAVLKEVAQNLTEEDVEIKIKVSPTQYLRIMQLSWLAFKIKEVDQPTAGKLIDRALGICEVYLKQLTVAGRRR